MGPSETASLNEGISMALSGPANPQYIHGQAKTSIWNIWQSMIGRCTQKGHTSYPRYGALGVTVCERWMGSFENFLADMGERPEGLSIERVGGAKVYGPTTCIWADAKTQALSRNTTRWITHDGETLCLKDWAAKVGMPYLKLYKRVVYRGIPFATAINN